MRKALLTIYGMLATLAGIAQWQTVGTVGFTAGTPQYLCLAVDGGTPYVAFKDGANGEKCTVMKFNGGNWVTVGNAGFTDGIARDQSLMVVDGQPFVAFTDAHNSNKPRVMTFDGTSWESVGPPVSNASCYGTSIAKSGDIIYLAWISAGNAYLHKFQDSAWSQVSLFPCSLGGAQDIDVAIHPSTGVPYVTYRDNYNGGKASVVKPNNSSGFDQIGGLGFTDGAVTNTRIEFKGDVPYISFRDVSSDKVTVMKFEGGWAEVGSAGFSAGSVVTPDLCIHNDRAYVAFSDVVDNDANNVMYYNGAAWTDVAGTSSTGKATGQRIVSSDGELYVAYYDWANGEKATVKHYVDCNVDVSVSRFGATLTANNTTTGVTYQWIDCNAFAPVTGATGQSFTPVVNGSYAVAVSEGSCVDTSACTDISNVGIDAQEHISLRLYPNPVSDLLYIESAEDLIRAVVYDMRGTVLVSGAEGQRLNVGHLPAGHYLVEVETRGAVMRQTFIKQ